MRKALDYGLRLRVDQSQSVLGLYKRTNELLRELANEGGAASRSKEELALLEPFRDKLPPEVFGEAYVPGAGDGWLGVTAPTCARPALLREAGWRLQSGPAKTAAGCQPNGTAQTASTQRGNDKGETLTSSS